jgi:hypothetical protein
MTYLAHGGRSAGRLFRPTTEEPIPGVLSLAFFYRDIDFSNVGADVDDASAVAMAYVPMFILTTELYTLGFQAFAALYFPPSHYYTSGFVGMYKATHYALLYLSLIQYHVNRI